MGNKSLPEDRKRRFDADSEEEVWRKYLTEGNLRGRYYRRLWGLLPSDPRCVNCHRPFEGIGSVLMRLIWGDLALSSGKNPRFCNGCYAFTAEYPGGAEIELTMLFVDVRGSTALAESMDDTEFSRLMNRFYQATIRVLVRERAFIDKLVGDEVTALFIPGYAGEKHAQKGVSAGRQLLAVTGHGDPDGPWIPVGVGVHTGVAWVGSIAGARGAAADWTALGDNVNIAARLASSARPGEVLVSEATIRAAGLDETGLESRDLKLKGKREAVSVRVIRTKKSRLSESSLVDR